MPPLYGRARFVPFVVEFRRLRPSTLVLPVVLLPVFRY